MKQKHPLTAILVACVLLCGALGIARADAPSVAQPQSQPQARDLGEALSYFRVTHLAKQLPDIRDALEKHPALVLDLRGAAGNLDASRAFRAALVPAKSGAHVARFVLINAATAPAIAFALGGGIDASGVPGVLVIAPASADVPANVKAPGSADDDTRACEAIAQGAPLYTLINHQPDKPRNDEAALMREQNGEAQQGAGAADTAASGTTSAVSPSASPSAPPPPLTDSVLQLAVQIHRSLVALKKL